ncbi:hypothetical protein GDO78_009185 [Eleutherodactylus coqui]|uniref:Torsin-1A-interacting protein 1/2 AAA+ activator domain-containing protein n=1 Tax=Eleutherodactylus coqui TaxID=57060 RepID=A0A8J6FA81_ELECQ|nr:hypothetical protein GDO78_009185 [Eleutherodactylus coqui]
MSQVGAAEKSSDEPKSQMSTADKSPEKEKSQPVASNEASREPELHVSSTARCALAEKSHAGTSDEPFGEEKEQIHARDELESQTGTADMSGEEEAPPATTADTSNEAQIGTTGVSREEEAPPATTADSSSESQTGTVDMSGEEEAPPATTADSSSESESQVSTANKSFANEKPQVNTAEKYTGEPQSPARTTNKAFGEQKSQENVADKASGEPGSQMGTKDKPGEQKSQWSNTNASLGGPEAETGSAGMPGGLQSQASITDMFSDKETSQEDVTDKASSHPKFQTSITDTCFGEEEPHVYAIKTFLGESPADKSSRAESLGDKCTSKEESQINTAGKQEFEARNELRRRPLTHSSAEPEPSPMSGTLEPCTIGKSSGAQVSQIGTTNKFGEQKTQTGIIIEKKLPTRYWMIGGFTVLVVVALVYFLYPWKGQPPAHKPSKLEIFFKEVASLKKDFPGQYEGLWFRSEKILHKHLNASDPSAPSILILTAAQDGEQTLRCVSKRLAKSYANSLGAKWLIVNGPSKSKYDSATSKMQIDDELSSGFQSDSRAAVLYRLETLPPGSLLILYKYCDHENAAFKDVALVLTVLLEEPSLEEDLSFTEVEEKVKDLLWERFANSEVSAHHEMDVDKLSGVWSRISHVVLPVLPVRSIESGSCPGITD